jgi:methylornithine synthase
MKKSHAQDRLESILSKAQSGRMLFKEDIVFLLGIRDESQIQALFKTARALRTRYFGHKVFLYGFVYISTFCRNDCKFCFFSRSNLDSRRYRKNPSEIIEASCRLADSGVHLIDLTMGEDPEFFLRGKNGFNDLVALVSSVKSATGLPIMISPGVVPDHVLENLAETGTTWYACYQETHRPDLFKQLRIKQCFTERLEKKRLAHQLGMFIEEGLICGIGETSEDIADSFEVIRLLDTDQMRVMSFVPQKGTPMADSIPPDPRREYLITAVMRLSFPDRLIPASLDVGGLSGLKHRLDAGANVVTSLVPPGQGLSGVAQNALDIEDGRRTSSSLQPVLDVCGLRTASIDDYLGWISNRREKLVQKDIEREIAC